MMNELLSAGLKLDLGRPGRAVEDRALDDDLGLAVAVEVGDRRHEAGHRIGAAPQRRAVLALECVYLAVDAAGDDLVAGLAVEVRRRRSAWSG
jgi:hypothetical protein